MIGAWEDRLTHRLLVVFLIFRHHDAHNNYRLLGALFEKSPRSRVFLLSSSTGPSLADCVDLQPSSYRASVCGKTSRISLLREYCKIHVSTSLATSTPCGRWSSPSTRSWTPSPPPLFTAWQWKLWLWWFWSSYPHDDHSHDDDNDLAAKPAWLGPWVFRSGTLCHEHEIWSALAVTNHRQL